jgi:hypothetical protein
MRTNLAKNCGKMLWLLIFYFVEIYIAYGEAIFFNGTQDPDLKLGEQSNLSTAMQTKGNALLNANSSRF